MFKRLMLAFTGLILIGVLITGILSMEIAKTYYYNSVEDKLVTSAKLIQNRLDHMTPGLHPADFDMLCREYGRITGQRITIIGADGTVLGDSNADTSDMENHGDRPEVRKALEEGFGKNTHQSGTLGIEMLYVALALENNRSTDGVIRVALPLDDIAVIEEKIWYYVFLAIFLGVSAALLLGYRYLSTVTKPIREMTEMASTIAGGKFNKRVRVKGSDEIGTLAATFNHMAERMERTVEELINDKSKIEAILASSVNGVVAVDNHQNTMFLNPNAEKMLDIREKDFVGKPLLDIIGSSEAKAVFKNILESRGEQYAEFQLQQPDKKTINVISAPIRPKVKHSRTIGTLMIIQDVTAMKKLEKMRSDFVTNVTHELKTPLTSIKGFVETLKEGAVEEPDKRKKFLDIIDIETERLERLIEDILLLSEIESGRSRTMTKEKIDMQEVIENEVLSMFARQAEENCVSIKTSFDENLPKLPMDRDRFKQMLINLVDNAIKFNVRKGEVLISVNKTDRAVVLKVADTGIGIPKRYHDRLFERFYRVDRGRSRKEGGTGLGLAIVKHIILSVNGSIEVSSQPGLGTEFRIEIPF
jgi:two-component system phosphate regulon sensor histidine kinase PhoR